jgi:protein-S-isoprenylcysteine O-methyltransferase Ste14
VLATAASRGTAGACLGAALIVLGLLIKARIEEQFLRLELGQEPYDAYARRVRMLVPFPHM